MGKHKKHHKKHSHGHATTGELKIQCWWGALNRIRLLQLPFALRASRTCNCVLYSIPYTAFPYPMPAFQVPTAPAHEELHVHTPDSANVPSFRVSIGLSSLQAATAHGSGSQRKHHHHHKSHHHHHHHKNAPTPLPSPPSGVGVSGRGSGASYSVDRPAIPPLRISLHDPARLAAASSSAPGISEGGEGKVSELKVSIPLPRLQALQQGSGEKEGGREEGERREHHHKKKHKKHKDRGWHELEAMQGSSGSGVKGTPRAEVGGKQVRFGAEGERRGHGVEGERRGHGVEGERKGHGVEGERKSYGGKGLGTSHQMQTLKNGVSGDNEIGTNAPTKLTKSTLCLILTLHSPTPHPHSLTNPTITLHTLTPHWRTSTVTSITSTRNE